MILSISYIDLLSINNIDKKIMTISNIEKLSIPNVDINVLSIPHVDKMSIPNLEKRFYSIWNRYNFYACAIDKKSLSILGIDKIIFSYIAYRQIFQISYGNFLHTSYLQKVFVSMTYRKFVCMCMKNIYDDYSITQEHPLAPQIHQ